ncbi:MAG: CoA pyrophosphatase [Cyclobacteriaceae bacterium]|nr:CoA pyrophosphatase [Cyclobacteriaceae bacterium]
MTFDRIIQELDKRLKDPLPAGRAHELLRARPVSGQFPDFGHKLPPKPGSVLILLFEEDGVIKLPLTKRATYKGAHSAQISFPGGKAEAGETVIEVALREAEEEIGVHRDDVHVIGTLSEFFVVPSNFMVTPVVGTLNYVPVFKPDPREVEKIIYADLNDIIRDDAVYEEEILAAGLYPMIAPHFLIENEIVWGATAMMLNEFREVLREIIER